MHSIAIVGGGIAAVEFAFHMRRCGYTGEISIYESEVSIPYQRPYLSKQYLDPAVDEPLESLPVIRAENQYRKNEIDVRTDTRIISINRRTRTLVTTDGEVIKYDAAVLATGSRPRALHLPGTDQVELTPLRSLADAIRIRRILEDATIRDLIVIGAGFIGLEVAAAARKWGKGVTLVEASDAVGGGKLSATVSDYLADIHRAQGVHIAFGASVQKFCPPTAQSRGTEVHYAGGGMSVADAVIVGVGTSPCIELARESGLATTDRGIIVDSNLTTSDPSVFAIGDCVQFPRSDGEGFTRMESVQNSVDQGRYLANRLCDDNPKGCNRFDPVPWIWSQQYSTRIQIAGTPDLREGGTQATSACPSRSGNFSVYHFDNAGIIRCVESINATREHMEARRLIKDRANISAISGVTTISRVNQSEGEK